MTSSFPLTALRMALANGRPAIFHSDQGVQYAAWEHTELLRNAGCQMSMAEACQPTQNTLVERFMGTFEEEHRDDAGVSSVTGSKSPT